MEIGPREGVCLGVNFGCIIVTTGDFTAYVCNSATTRPSSQITLGRLVMTMPITSCSRRLDDEAVKTAVILRLSSPLCAPHPCRCDSLVDTDGLHSFVCKQAPGRLARHHAMNHLIARAFASADIPVTKEPQVLSQSDGKRPDGWTLILWQVGKVLTWAVTVVSQLANSCIHTAAQDAGAVAELTAARRQPSTLCWKVIIYFSQCGGITRPE